MLSALISQTQQSGPEQWVNFSYIAHNITFRLSDINHNIESFSEVAQNTELIESDVIRT